MFGSENHIATIAYRVFGVRAGLFLDSITDNIIWYAKNKETAKYRQLYLPVALSESKDNEFEPVRLYRPGFSTGLDFEYVFQDAKYKNPSNMHWATGKAGLERLRRSDRLIGFKADVRYKRYTVDFPASVLTTAWQDTWGEQEKNYVVQTATKVLERCLLMTTDPGDLVLDPTCGSGTTAYVAEQWGRRWITIDTSRVAIALARTRLMAGRFPYYLLADSYEGRKKERELNPLASDASPLQSLATGEGPGVGLGDIKRGFVYRRVPHVTLKSIANNEEIDVIHEKYQPRLEDLRTKINKAAGQKWEEWQIPREVPIDNGFGA